MLSQPTLPTDEKQQRKNRPRGVTILALWVLILAVLNLTRLMQSLIRWDFLKDTLPFNPVYLAINGVFWSLVGLFLLWSIWFQKNWTRRALIAAALLYSLNVWLERIFLAGSPTRNTNWPFVALVNLLILAFIFWQLNRQAVKFYFGEMHDR